MRDIIINVSTILNEEPNIFKKNRIIYHDIKFAL